MTLKTSCPLSLEQTLQLMDKRALGDIASLKPLQRKLCLQMQSRLLHPVVIVEYERRPYVYKNGNVRVTFDTNISAGADVAEFLSPGMKRRPIMPAGQHLMEVKFDEYLPDFIYRSLNLGQLQQTTFSKYSLCRKYTRIT